MSATTKNENKFFFGSFEQGIDLVVLIAVLTFLFIQLHPHVLFSPTITAGGDTPSHYLAFDYLRLHLLPKGHISGWSQGNYAGFPILQNYFPLPFLIMAFLSLFIPATIAFKLGTVLGILFLPLGAYIGLRAMRLLFPIPILGAISVLSFLFMEANSMWGGNIPSTLAGEFAFGLSMALSLAWAGTLYRGIQENTLLLWNTLLLVGIGLSHGCGLIFSGALSLYFLLSHKSFDRHVFYLVRMHGLAILLLGFWLVPFVMGGPWTTPFVVVWYIGSWKEILPPILWPYLALAPFAFLKESRREALYLAFGLFCTGYLYWISPKLQVADIRFFPFLQVLVCLLGAIGLGNLSQKISGKMVIPFIIFAATALWVGKNSHFISTWVDWNYSGFEVKTPWKLFLDINTALKDSDQAPRVIYENSPRHNIFGTMRAFECLPFFAHRNTLEHAYLQASPSSPFVFYLQSEISKEASCPFPEYGCTTMNYDHAKIHLQLFNVRDIIVLSAEAKKQLAQLPEYTRRAQLGEYEIWDLKGPSDYVTVVSNEPILWTGGNWKSTSYAWFRIHTVDDIPLVFPLQAKTESDPRFTLKSDDLASLPRRPLSPPPLPVLSEHLSDTEIVFETTQLHRPHLIKVSYDPHWHVEGADAIFLASPSFMLVYPTQAHVRLYYARIWSDDLGLGLTMLGFIGILLFVFGSKSFDFTSPLLMRYFRPITVALGTMAGLLLLLAVAKIHQESPGVLVTQGTHFRDEGKLDAAEKCFSTVLEKDQQSGYAETAQYFLAIIKYLKHDWRGCLRECERLHHLYPDSRYRAEIYYHMAICYEQLHDQEGFQKSLSILRKEYPESVWVGYARDRWKNLKQ